MVSDTVPLVLPIIRSYVLGSIMMWKLKWTKKRTTDLMVKTFGTTELHKALCQLAVASGRGAPSKRRDGGTRSGDEAYAGDIYALIEELDEGNLLPEIVVPCDELSRCPVDTGREDDPTILTRMDRLEQMVKQVLDRVPTDTPTAAAVGAGGGKPRTVGGGGAIPRTGGGGNSGDGAGAGGVFEQALARARSSSFSQGRGRGRTSSVASRADMVQESDANEPVTQSQPWADVVAGGLKRGRAGQRDEEGFIIPGRPARKIVPKGTSTIDLRECGTLCAPIERYVGKTGKRVTKEIVEQVLKKCAAKLPGGDQLEILEVEQVNGHLQHVQTKAWKVTVPFNYRAIMDNKETYPVGWEYRAYFAPRGERGDTSGKRRRQGEPPCDPMVAHLIQQAEREKVSAQQTEDDRYREQLTAGIRAGVAEELAKNAEATGPEGEIPMV